MDLHAGDACPHCWHQPNIQFEEGGLGTYNIGSLIKISGGNINKNGTCNTCNINYTQALHCEHCNPDQPCSKHYATVFNGSHWKEMPLEIHLLYMRNSPYDRDWANRPKNIGSWYAFQCDSYLQAVDLLKRFTSGADIHYKLYFLNTSDGTEFWKGLHTICLDHFSGQDPVSIAVTSFYNTFFDKMGV
tara:strand:- start:697 stop:1260 length:564 start_codon:yes stop_codon:yes gene_type:complete